MAAPITRVQARRAEALRANPAAFAMAEVRPAAHAEVEARLAAYAHFRAYDHARVFAHIWAYVSLAMKASGLLALLLSTVILLGGYVQSLGMKDFFSIMTISVIQAAGIFQDWYTNFEYLKDFLEIAIFGLFNVFLDYVFFPDELGNLLIILICAPLVYPFHVLVGCIGLFYLVGPLACAGISSWRIAKLNHDNHSDGTDSMTDMMATLNLFYSLIIFQGAMFFVLLVPMKIYKVIVARDLRSLEQLSDKWGKEAIDKYLSQIRTKCKKDPLSIKGMDMIKYAAELLDSESQEDYLYGARLLSTFVRKGEDVHSKKKGGDVRWVLLPSRHRIQRLIDSLMISSSSSSSSSLDEDCVHFGSKRCYAVIGGLDDKKEIREHAATILAHVAAHINDLAQYPGAMRCISSLFQDQEDTTQAYRRNSKQIPDDPPQHQEGKLVQKLMRVLIRLLEWQRVDLMRDQKRMEKREHQHRNKREGGTSNELIQQGLTILERLASNSDDNRRIICGAPGLLPKITAPLYSATLIEDLKNKAWADIVTRCLKVLYQLIHTPAGWTCSRMLRHQISSDDQALNNLKRILVEVGNDEAYHQELQLVTMEVLTELAVDRSINLNEETKKEPVTKQLQLFLLANGHDEKESAAIAGRAMVSLSANSESNFAHITGRLTELSLDLSVNLSDEIKKELITKQLQLFLLANGDDEESATIAGRAIVSLSTNSESNCAVIMTTQDDIIGLLTGILDDKKNITQRTIAAEIMGNLCAHCNVDNMREILAKVLREIMSIKTKSQERKNSAELNNKKGILRKVRREIMSIKIKLQQRKASVNQKNPALGDDEENQGNPVSTITEERHNIWTQGNHTETEEISDQEREEQEAFLSLAQVICDKLNSTDLDGAIRSAVGQNNTGRSEDEEQRREAFVEKLKTIIDDNFHPTADSLRIVKLCSRIAGSVIRCKQYVGIFKKKEFKSSLSKASEIMSELESCMLFVGTDFGPKKTVRPLFSKIEEKFQKDTEHEPVTGN